MGGRAWDGKYHSFETPGSVHKGAATIGSASSGLIFDAAHTTLPQAALVVGNGIDQADSLGMPVGLYNAAMSPSLLVRGLLGRGPLSTPPRVCSIEDHPSIGVRSARVQG